MTTKVNNVFRDKYYNDVRPALVEHFGYSSIMQAPKIEKIVLNMGVGDAVHNSKNLENAVAELTKISGQKPVITRAKKPYVENVCMTSSVN